MEQPTFAIVAAAGVSNCIRATSDRLTITKLNSVGTTASQITGELLCTRTTDGNPDDPYPNPIKKDIFPANREKILNRVK